MGADFIFSAHISTENHLLTYQDFSISPVMRELNDKEEAYLCTINKPKKHKRDYEYLLEHKEELLECFYAKKVKVYGSSITRMMKSNSNTQIFIIPTSFRSIFDKKKCKIYELRDKNTKTDTQ